MKTNEKLDLINFYISSTMLSDATKLMLIEDLIMNR